MSLQAFETAFYHTLRAVIARPWLFWAVFIANLFGAVVGGIYWYGPMLITTPLIFYLFVPDCPLSALLFAIALLGIKYNRRWYLFYTLTAFACVKYGLWTVGYWMHDWGNGGMVEPISVMLFLSHVGLFVQGLLLLPYATRASLLGRIAVILWFMLSIYVDYQLRYHPPLGPHVSQDYAMWLAGGLTAMLGTGLLLLPRRSAIAATPPTLGERSNVPG